MFKSPTKAPHAMKTVIDGKFEVFRDDVIGRGGISVVYRGEDVRTRKPVAVKQLQDRYRSKPDVLRRFRNEARMTSFASHPSVVEYFGYFPSGPWIVLEMIDGRDLKSLIKEEGPLPLPVAVDYLAQIAASLDHLHGRRVVHLDIKPQNVLVDPSGRIKLIDFGLAQEFAHSQDLIGDEIFGTAAYLAPEQVNHEPVGVHTDIYSLGCVFHEMVTGSAAFAVDGLSGEAEQHALIELHRLVEPTPPSQVRADLGLPVWVDDVIGRALEKMPANRFPTAGAFALAAQRGISGSRVELTGATKTLVPAAQPASEPPADNERVDEEVDRGPSLARRVWVSGGRRLRESPRMREIAWRMFMLAAIVTLVVGLNVASDGSMTRLTNMAIGIAPAVTTSVTVEGVNVRSGPSMGADILTSLSVGDQVEITGLPRDGSDREWWPIVVNLDGQEIDGWIWSDAVQSSGWMGVFALPDAIADTAESIGDAVSGGVDTVAGWWPG